MMLMLGGPTGAQIEALRPVYLEHKDRFPPGTWAHEWFDNGVDIAAPEPLPVDWDAIPLDDTDTVLPGTAEYNARIFADTAA